MTSKLTDTCLATITKLSKHGTTATSTSHFVSMGCTFWFTGPNSDIPAATWGYATLVGLSGGPSSTIPCGKFLSDVVKIPSTDLASDGSSAATSDPSTTAVTVASSHVMTGHDPDPTIVNNYTSTSSAYTGPVPTFRASDVTGCYAMTGLETTTYVTPTTTYVTTGASALDVTSMIGFVTTSMACSHLMTMNGPQLPNEVLTDFVRSPVCSSYVSWAKDHPDVPLSVYPAGVYNADAVTDWYCAGKCFMEVASMSAMYFATKSFDGCSAVSSATSADPSVTKYAVVGGSTL